MLIDVVVRPGFVLSRRAGWFLLVFFMFEIGAVIYYFVGRNTASAGIDLQSPSQSAAPKASVVPAQVWPLLNSFSSPEAFKSTLATVNTIYPQPDSYSKHDAGLKSDVSQQTSARISGGKLSLIIKIPLAIGICLVAYAFLSLLLTGFSPLRGHDAGLLPTLNSTGQFVDFIIIAMLFMSILKK